MLRAAIPVVAVMASGCVGGKKNGECEEEEKRERERRDVSERAGENERKGKILEEESGDTYRPSSQSPSRLR